MRYAKIALGVFGLCVDQFKTPRNNEGTLLSCVDACLLKTGSLSLNIEGLTHL